MTSAFDGVKRQQRRNAPNLSLDYLMEPRETIVILLAEDDPDDRMLTIRALQQNRLAICRRIVERHHGIITAHSTPGEGAQFVIMLPMQQPPVSSESDGV